MRGGTAVALGALLACACRGGGGAPDPRPGSPPEIDVVCVVVLDGALCTFSNRGGPGARCVKALYAEPGGDVHVSPEVCSGSLRGDGVATSLARFTRRPADACGAHLGACTARIAEPGAAEAVADAWRAELGAPAEGPLTEDECEKLWAHAMDLEYRERTAGDDPDAQHRADEWRQYMEEDYHDPFVAECVSEYSRKQLACGLGATTREELERCE